VNTGAFADYERHVNPTLGAFLRLAGRDVRFVRATGGTLEDDTGRAWTDWISGFGAFPLGHNPPALTAVMHDTVDDERFLAGVRARGAALFGALQSALAGSPAVERVSWRGLLGGIALHPTRHPWLAWENLGLPALAAQPVAGALVVERLARSSILAQVCAHDWSVVRVQPPLTVDDAACARFVAALTDAIAWLGDHE
jgi:acetylornithine/succinyldiaminopimelate/putrescine aminotransferase